MKTLKDTINSIKRNKDSKHFVKEIDEGIIKFRLETERWIKVTPLSIAKFFASKWIKDMDDIDICVRIVYFEIPD